LDNTPATHKVGIVSGLGDRRDEDTISFARVAGRIFDEVILRQDKDLRGKTGEEIYALMTQGLRMDKPDLQITYIEDETEAINHALHTAQSGSVISIFTEKIPATLKQLEEFEAQVVQA
jgi:cyanophycin synthetase